MPRPDGTTSPAHPRPSQATTDDPFAPPTHYLFQDKKRRRAPPRHARIPSLLLNQFSSFEAFGSPPPTYSSQPPPPSPPVIIDHESVHSDSDDSASDDDARSLTHDGSKNILIERLSHIIRHLQITPETGDMVDELHSKVDEMYGVMGKFLCFDGHSTSDGNIFGPLSHTTQSRTDHTKPTGWTHHFKQEEDPLPTPTPTPRKSDMTPLLTAEITNLNTKLSTVLQSLRTRKEETDVRPPLPSPIPHILTPPSENPILPPHPPLRRRHPHRHPRIHHQHPHLGPARLRLRPPPPPPRAARRRDAVAVVAGRRGDDAEHELGGVVA